MDLTGEAERPVRAALGRTDGDDAGDVKPRTGTGKLWAQRWLEPEWNFALLRAAALAGVHRIWRSGKTHGRMTVARETMATAFATESSGMATTGEDPLASRTLWKRLEVMVETAIAAEDYKRKMTCTEWEAFLKSESSRKGEQGYKKWAALTKYCIMVGWLPAGVDDPRYPSNPTMLEKAEAAAESLKDLVSAHGVMMDFKDVKKVAAAAAADKGVKKDTDGLALER